MVIVTESPLVPEELTGKISMNSSGSVIFHYAVVKDRAGGKQTSGISFERNGDIELELSGIEADTRSRWDIDDILLVRRTGELRTGDLISLVAVSAAASGDAFEACRYGLESIKRMTTLKKKELYID